MPTAGPVRDSGPRRDRGSITVSTPPSEDGTSSIPEAPRSAEPFEKLEREDSLADRVADSILKRIVSGELNPGDRLPSERELGEQFRVSRTVVREAVRMLTGRGVISVRPGSGICVAPVDPAALAESLRLLMRSDETLDYEHVHEVRAMLEVQVAGIAADRATSEDIERIAAAFEAMKRSHEVESTAQRDLAFHRSIARATHNVLYLVLHDAIGEALLDVRRSNLTYGGLREAMESHRLILECIAAHDRVGAMEAMRLHLEAVAAQFHQRGSSRRR